MIGIEIGIFVSTIVFFLVLLKILFGLQEK